MPSPVVKTNILATEISLLNNFFIRYLQGKNITLYTHILFGVESGFDIIFVKLKC